MAPVLLVLVGIPGSGKTTLAQRLCGTSSLWQWINQDTLGDRSLCEHAVQDALMQGRSPIIDRCNSTERQRSNWLSLARAMYQPASGIHTIAVQLLLPLDLCVQRVQQRVGHPTLAPHAAAEVCSRFFSEFETVQHYEGFSEVLTVRQPAEIQALAHLLNRRVELHAKDGYAAAGLQLKVPASMGTQGRSVETASENTKAGREKEFVRAKRGRWDQTHPAADGDDCSRFPQQHQHQLQQLHDNPPATVHSQQHTSHKATVGLHQQLWAQVQPQWQAHHHHQQQQPTWQQAHWLQPSHHQQHMRWEPPYQDASDSSSGGGRRHLDPGLLDQGHRLAQPPPAPAHTSQWVLPHHPAPALSPPPQPEVGPSYTRHAAGGAGAGRGGRGGGRGGEGSAAVAQLRQLFADPLSKVPYDAAPPGATAEAAAVGSVASAVPDGPLQQLVTAGTPSSAGQQQRPDPGAEAQQVLRRQDSKGTTDVDKQAQHQADAASPAPAPGPAPGTAVVPAVGSTLNSGLAVDTRVILLFDLNGTLTSHTTQRYSSGTNKARPSVKALLRLKPRFRLGIFTSATVRTVSNARDMLEDAAGVEVGELFEAGLILYRDHTCPAPAHVQAANAKSWETVKPLSRWFSRLHRVVLFDDDLHKALPEEQGNLVSVPCWDDNDPEDTVLEDLVEAVLEVLGPLGEDEDVRGYTSAVTRYIADRVAGSGLSQDAAAEAVQDEATRDAGGEQELAPLHTCLTDDMTVLGVQAP